MTNSIIRIVAGVIAGVICTILLPHTFNGGIATGLAMALAFEAARIVQEQSND